MLVLLAWGSVATIRITKESAPEVQIPVGIVTTALPGASAEDIEKLVTNKLEQNLTSLTNLEKLTSTSRDGVSVIVAEFSASANLNQSIQDLKDQVDKVRGDLPADATDPSVTDVNFVDQPIQIISITADLPFAKFAELGEEVKNELQTVRGVSKVTVSGVRNREINVVVKKEQIARYGISLSQVVAAISSANASLPVGAITVGNISYNIAFEGGLDTVSAFHSIPLLLASNQVVYLRDIADVSDGVEKATSYSRVAIGKNPSRQALTLAVFKTHGQDVTTTTGGVKQKLDELTNTLLRGSEIVITYDTGEEVAKDLYELTRTGIITMTLVMLVLFATLGWREALVAGMSVPFSFLIAFVGLWYSGNTFNFVSLFSLILAIGILVDSGIVVVEAIHTRVRIFGDKKKAAIQALEEYAWPLIGGTMTTVAVFIPLFFISGIVGKFIASIPYTVIFVLMASIFVALGFVPMWAMLCTSTGRSPLTDRQEQYTEKMRVWYTQKLGLFFKNRAAQNRFLVAIFASFILAVLLPITGIIKVNFFPQDDSDFLYVDIELPVGTELETSDLSARQVEEALYGLADADSTITSVGNTSSFGNNPQSGARYANVTINLAADRAHSSTDILAEVQTRLKNIHSATIRAGQPSGGPPVGAPILIQFFGQDRDALDQALLEAQRALQKISGIINIDPSNKNDGTEFILRINRDKVAALGLTPQAVALTLRTAIAGSKATTLVGGERDVNLMVSLNLNPVYTDPHDASRVSLDAIHQIPIQTPSGASVLLGSVLESSIGRSDAVINHENRQRVASISTNLEAPLTTAEAIEQFNKNMAGVELPKGVTMKIGGENEQTNRSFAEMGFALVAGLALMFVILVLAFNSFRFTTYLLSVVPLSLIGVFGGLALTGQALSFSSLLGIIALAGVIINHAIILMDAIIKRMRASAGYALSDIVVDAAVSRLRPIVLTTVTTVIGMIPLTTVSALWGPLAFAILFGLSFAMILTLVLIPTLVYRWPGKLPSNVTRGEYIL